MAKSEAEAWRQKQEAELARRSEKTAKERAEKAERWRAEHEVELQWRAEEKQRDREARRAANVAAHEAQLLADGQATDARYEARLAAKAEKAAKWAERALPINDPFTIAQAGRLGITPQEFLDLQAERQEMARKTPSIAEQMAHVPVVGERRKDH